MNPPMSRRSDVFPLPKVKFAPTAHNVGIARCCAVAWILLTSHIDANTMFTGEVLTIMVAGVADVCVCCLAQTQGSVLGFPRF